MEYESWIVIQWSLYSNFFFVIFVDRLFNLGYAWVRKPF